MTELNKTLSTTSPVRPRSTHLEPVQLSVTLTTPIGGAIRMSDDGEKVVESEHEHIEIGDRILSINGKTIDSRTREDVIQLIEETGPCELTLLRPPKIEPPAGFVKSIDTSIAYYEHAIRSETEEQNKCFDLMQYVDMNSSEYASNQAQIRESKKREGDFRKAILSLQEEEKQWAGLRPLLDSKEDALSLVDVYQFVLYCLEKQLIGLLLFADDIRQLHTSKKPLDTSRKIFATYLDVTNDEWGMESLVNEHEELVKRAHEQIETENAGPALFAEFEPIISRTLFNALDEFRTKLTTERILSGGQDIVKSVDDVFARDANLLEVIRVDNGNLSITQLESQIRLLRALHELSKPLQNKGNAKLKQLLTERNDQLKRAKKLDGQSRSRPKSMVAFSSGIVQSGKFAVSSLKRIYTTRTTSAEQAPERLVPLVEHATANESSNASPMVTKRETGSLHSVDSSPSDDIELEDVEEEKDPLEFRLKEVTAWETQVRNEGTLLDVASISKKERARQNLIHELMVVHHNACIKINFLIHIYKPTILAMSKLKASQLTPIFRNIDEIKIKFDALKIDLEERQRAQWPLLGGIGDIMLDHFNLDTEKGRNFQQQVAKWVSKDNEANAQIKKWQNEQIEQILGFQAAVDEADRDPRLNKLSFNNVLTVIFQTMPRYPMLLSGILRYTDTPENQDDVDMMKEKELLERAKDSVQVTVSEINKRVSEEELNGLLTDIKTHLSIHDFLKVATTDSIWGRFTDVKSRLEMDKVIHYGTGKVNEMMSGKSTDVTFVLLEDSFVFFKINNLNGHKTYSVYSTEMAKPTKPGEQAEMAKVFYFFAIESLHIRRNESETAKRVIYLIDKASMVSCTLDLGTNDNANNLISAVSAQQAERERHNSLSNSRTQSPVEEEEEKTAGEVEDDLLDGNVNNRSSSSAELDDNNLADNGSVSLDSPVELIDESSAATNTNAPAAPIAPPRSIRRDGFRRTAVRHVDSVSLLDECQRHVDNLGVHLADSDEARDALVSLQQLFQRYKNTLSS